MPAAQKARLACKVIKTLKSRNLVFGHLIVCKVKGEEYRDCDLTVVPEDVMLDGALEWARSVKVADVMHGEDAGGGTHPFLFPMTTEVAKAYGWDNPEKTGLMVAQQVDDATFARFESGELTGFSVDADAVAEFE